MAKMDYKSKYQRLLATFWIMILIGSCFFWHIFGVLNRLDADVKDFKTQQMIQMYIDSGWIPPYEKTKKKEKNND